MIVVIVLAAIAVLYLLSVTGALEVILSAIGHAIGALLVSLLSAIWAGILAILSSLFSAIWTGLVSLASAIWAGFVFLLPQIALPALIIGGIFLVIWMVRKAYFS